VAATLAEAGMAVDGWRIHRRIGMSGGLFTRAVAREIGRAIAPEEAEALQRRHEELFQELLPERRALPGPWSCCASSERPVYHTASRPPAGALRLMLHWKHWA